jgi:hypothetical protein
VSSPVEGERRAEATEEHGDGDDERHEGAGGLVHGDTVEHPALGKGADQVKFSSRQTLSRT